MEIYLERGEHWIGIEGALDRWNCYLIFSWSLFGRSGYREWFLMVKCPICGGRVHYEAWDIYEDVCPLCNDEGRAWPTGWLRYQFWCLVDWLTLPYVLWVYNPAYEYEFELGKSCDEHDWKRARETDGEHD